MSLEVPPGGPTSSAGSGNGTLLRAVSLEKVYQAPEKAARPLVLFRGLHLEVAPGEMVAITGRSGAGKSSLLHLLAGLETPTGGEVWVGDHPLHALSPGELAAVRNRQIGYVWQFHYLLPEFTAEENVALPLLARGDERRTAYAAAGRWLARVGLQGRGHHRSGELSGGEQQRVAIARALVTEPRILLADEPTGDLDEETAQLLFTELRRLCREQALAAILVTHNDEIAQGCDRMLRLTEGRLEPVLVR